MAMQLTEMGTRPEIPSAVDVFLRARRGEIATEVAETA
jgi:hypothetical protein